MTQVEFENQMRELNGQKAQVLNHLQLMQNSVNEEKSLDFLDTFNHKLNGTWIDGVE